MIIAMGVFVLITILTISGLVLTELFDADLTLASKIFCGGAIINTFINLCNEIAKAVF